jgi:hypothetical protein
LVIDPDYLETMRDREANESSGTEVAMDSYPVTHKSPVQQQLYFDRKNSLVALCELIDIVSQTNYAARFVSTLKDPSEVFETALREAKKICGVLTVLTTSTCFSKVLFFFI